MTADEARKAFPFSIPSERALYAEIMTMFESLTKEQKQEYLLIACEFIKEKLK
jgi:hypothetical protein